MSAEYGFSDHRAELRQHLLLQLFQKGIVLVVIDVAIFSRLVGKVEATPGYTLNISLETQVLRTLGEAAIRLKLMGSQALPGELAGWDRDDAAVCRKVHAARQKCEAGNMRNT
nr:hypothetical protein [Herbaspirillum sp. SJZ107]